MRPARDLLGPRRVRVGCLVFQDPLPLCGLLYLLLYFDSSGFLRVGLLAAFLHECGHILVYWLFKHRMPVIAVTMTGFCMRTQGAGLTAIQTLLLAAAGPGTNLLLAGVWYFRMSRRATLWGAAFLAANCLTAAFNLLPIPPLDGAQILHAAVQLRRQRRKR